MLILLAGVVAILAGPARRLWAFVGLIYAGALVVSVCALRDSPDVGLLAVAWLFAVVWGTDVFAYFGGRMIGGPKLWPRVSAGKTWSGTITGVLSGALLGLAVVHFGGAGPTRSLPIFLASLVAAALAQVGDLGESMVKRRFGVKDSSQFIPGHGGVMDRLDGFIFASALRGPAWGFSRLVVDSRRRLFLVGGISWVRALDRPGRRLRAADRRAASFFLAPPAPSEPRR